MRLPFPDFRRRADQWVSRHLLWICLAGFLILCFLFGMANYYGDQVEQAVDKGHILPKKQAKAIVAAKKDAEQKATYYKRKATKLQTKADSTQRLATVAKNEADSLRSVYDQVPAAAAGPLADIAFGLQHYQSPDTSATE